MLMLLVLPPLLLPLSLLPVLLPLSLSLPLYPPPRLLALLLIQLQL
uniref:Uncharacterized protein n=1 Tax=Picea glauca TaxID=3330 RepID=A0A101LZU3_PICGL|nr:hypothetical protein ABT39_MTgene5370 [Picea glauca]QHR88967.1 hypothetical protein Q903MT_gene2986 [Picea sitchensis]